MGVGVRFYSRSRGLAMNRRIILASKSKARRQLLKQMGIRFTVSSSGIKERHLLGRGGCARLVVDNAKEKAMDVARRYKTGVVIGADTVVLVGKKIIGKPKDICDARRTLKIISKRPQWVYTGIAVIDIDNKKMYLGHEKTKVYMYKLTDKEITGYFKKVSPLDKAGSFDIQGLGGLFIDRIEGCFYNVVGLPVAKLSGMLRLAGIHIFQ